LGHKKIIGPRPLGGHAPGAPPPGSASEFLFILFFLEGEGEEDRGYYKVKKKKCYAYVHFLAFRFRLFSHKNINNTIGIETIQLLLLW